MRLGKYTCTRLLLQTKREMNQTSNQTGVTMHTVTAYFDGGPQTKEFDDMAKAQAFQALLVFEYGIDAEID